MSARNCNSTRNNHKMILIRGGIVALIVFSFCLLTYSANSYATENDDFSAVDKTLCEETNEIINPEDSCDVVNPENISSIENNLITQSNDDIGDVNNQNEFSLGIVSQDNDWNAETATELEYDSSTGFYHVQITFGYDWGWKIVKNHDWSVNWGAVGVSYVDKKAAFKAKLRAAEDEAIPTPYVSSPCDIYMQYVDDNNLFIGVNTEPVPVIESPFSITGNQWDWDAAAGPSLEYDSQLEIYHAKVTFTDMGGWKIVKNKSWDMNWGGELRYFDDKSQARGTVYGGNMLPPYLSRECDIYFKYSEDYVTYIGVNMLPEWNLSLSISGQQWGWDTSSGPEISYDAEKDIYCTNVKFEDMGGWKIIKNHSWDVSWGVENLTYKDTRAAFKGELTDKNIPTPTTSSEVKIYVKYYDNNHIYIGVNTYPKVDVELSLTGSQWEWDATGGVNFMYDESEFAYHARVKFLDLGSPGEWKIVKDHAWSVAFGGDSIDYDQDVVNFDVYTYGGNLNCPIGTVTYDIYIEYCSDSAVSVTMIKKEFCEISLHSDDQATNFKYVMDGAEKETSSDHESLPVDDCFKLYINSNYIIDGKKTSALIAEDENSEVKHTCLFMVNFGFGYNYVDPLRIQSKTDLFGLVNEVIVLLDNPPFPVKNINVKCTSNQNIRYYDGENWVDAESIDFDAANSGQDIIIYDSDSFNEGVVAISDGHDNVVNIKSPIFGVILNKDKVIFDKNNFKIFVDYSEEYTYSVKSKNDMGSIFPEEAIDVDSFADCKYKIEDNKITLTLGSIAKEYIAKPADGNIFSAWHNGSGDKISNLEGNLSELDPDGNVEIVANFVNSEPPAPTPDPSEDINATSQTGDNGLLLFLVVCALLSSAGIIATCKKV